MIKGIHLKKAGECVKDARRLKKISEGAKIWLARWKSVPMIGDTAEDLMDIIDLVNDYADRKYRTVPKRVIVAAVAALLYVVSPIDILPGFLDDIVVVGIIMDMGVSAELKKYKEWKAKGNYSACSE